MDFAYLSEIMFCSFNNQTRHIIESHISILLHFFLNLQKRPMFHNYLMFVLQIYHCFPNRLFTEAPVATPMMKSTSIQLGLNPDKHNPRLLLLPLATLMNKITLKSKVDVVWWNQNPPLIQTDPDSRAETKIKTN